MSKNIEIHAPFEVMASTLNTLHKNEKYIDDVASKLILPELEKLTFYLPLERKNFAKAYSYNAIGEAMILRNEVPELPSLILKAYEKACRKCGYKLKYTEDEEVQIVIY